MDTRHAGNLRLYLILFAAQTLGAFILFWFAVPHYRSVLANPSGHQPSAQVLAWSLPSIALMQVAYWLRFRLRPDRPALTSAVAGHVVLFAGRFLFVFAASVISFVFLVPRPGFELPIGRYILTLLGAFAIFCYWREVDELGEGLLPVRTSTGAADDKAPT